MLDGVGLGHNDAANQMQNAFATGRAIPWLLVGPRELLLIRLLEGGQDASSSPAQNKVAHRNAEHALNTCRDCHELKAKHPSSASQLLSAIAVNSVWLCQFGLSP